MTPKEARCRVNEKVLAYFFGEVPIYERTKQTWLGSSCPDFCREPSAMALLLQALTKLSYVVTFSGDLVKIHPEGKERDAVQGVVWELDFPHALAQCAVTLAENEERNRQNG